LLNGNLFLQAAATGDDPISWQWRFNGAKLPDQTNSSLSLDYVQPYDAGTYDVYAINPGGSAFSAAAQVVIAEAPFILSAPPGIYGTNGGSNATLTVVAGGTPPLSYQWKADGADIPGATTPSLAFTNLVLNQSAVYGLTISNAYGIAATNITLLVLIKPTITNHIVPQTVLQGGTAVFSVGAGTNHPLVPIGYRWLRNGSGIQTGAAPVLVLSNVQATVQIRVIVTNAALSSGTFSPGPQNQSVLLTMLPDVDGDGMADAWETNYFGTVNTTNNAANALQDPDGDGMINRDEYVAGTNPTDALSVLKIVLTATNANVLQFVAQANVSYTVQSGTNLASATWDSLTGITGSSLVRTIQVNAATAPPSDQRYFRVVTPLVP
jgi:hypothetical protein